MEIQDCSKKVLHLLAIGTLAVTLIAVSNFPAQAKDKSGVLRAKGYYLDLSDPYRLCFWPCWPRTCLMMAS